MQRSTLLRVLLLVVAPSVTVSCGGVTDHDEEALGERVWCAQDPAKLPPVRNIDDEYADWATRVPGGFGGFWIENGNGRFNLKDLSQQNAAANMLFTLVGSSGGPRSGYRAVQGQYDYLELYGCYQIARGLAFSVSDVISTDIDERVNRIVIGVRNESGRTAVAEKLRAANIPSEMVVLELGSPPVLRGSQ